MSNSGDAADRAEAMDVSLGDGQSEGGGVDDDDDDGVDSGVVHAGALYTVGPWQAFLDHASQCSYFYNVDTGASEWEPPPEVVEYLQAAGEQSGGAGDVDQEPYDPKTDPNYIGARPSSAASPASPSL